MAIDHWTMTVPPPSGGDYIPCPPGNHPGRIIGLYDVGYQLEVRKNKKTGLDETAFIRKLIVVFEVVKMRPDGDPHVLGLKFTCSMSDSSNFFKFVVSATGQRYASNQQFDPLSLLSIPVMVNVTNTPPKADGSVYANVQGVTQYPEGFPAPSTTITPRSWSIMEGTPAPVEPWLPRIFGFTIAELAASGLLEKPQAPAAPTSTTHATTPAPVAGDPRPAAEKLEYSPYCLALMRQYGLAPGFNDEALNELYARLEVPPTHRVELDCYAIPF